MSCLRDLLAVLIGGMIIALPSAVAADPAPEFDVSATAITLSISDCGMHCVVTSWFAPVTTQTSASISFTNKSNFPLVLSAVFDASGAYPDAWQSAVKLCFLSLETDGKPQCRDSTSGVQVPVGGRARLKVALTASDTLSPAKYGGNLLFTATAAPPASQPLRTTKMIPLTVNVRADALRVLLALLAGVIGGRMFKQISTQDSVKVMALYDRYLHLRAFPPIDVNDPLTQWWSEQLDTIKGQLDQRVPDTTAIANSLQKLEDTSILVHSIATTRDWVSKLPSTDQQAKVDQDLQLALTAIVQGDLDQAKSKYDSALKDAVAISTSSLPVLGALHAIAPRVTAGFAALRAVPPPSNFADKVRTNAVSVLNWISGDSPIPVEIEYSYIRPIMALALLVVLAIYGMWQNYSGSDDVSATFGAQGIASYAIIFLWGFSTQVLTSTLQSLPFGRPTISVKS